jgi:hypothetical protein
VIPAWPALFAELRLRPQRKLLDVEWSRRVGAPFVAALRKQKLLLPSGPATTYLCDRSGHDCSRRVVEESHDAATHAYVGYCSHAEAPGCPPLPLHEEQLASSTFDFVAWTKRLQKLFKAEPVGPRDAVSLSDTWDLGRASFGGSERSIWLTLSAARPEFVPLLAARRAAHTPTLLLVVDAAGLPAEVRADYREGEVRVLPLEDLLDLSRVTLALSDRGAREQAGPGA